MIWEISFLTSIITLGFGIFKRSWFLTFISAIAFLPTAYYFSGANSALKYIGLTPIILLLLTTYFWFLRRNTKTL